MLCVPGGAPRVIARIGRRVEQHHGGVERAAAGRKHLDPDIAFVPVPQRLANVDAVAHAGGELFALHVVGLHDAPRPIEHVRAKTFDAVVLGGPTALTVGVPPHLPTLDFAPLGATHQIEPPPRNRMTW